MALPLKSLAQLATARHGFDGLALTQPEHKLVIALAENPDIASILSHLVQQRKMLEAEVSRLGYKVTCLQTMLHNERERIKDLEARITDISNN